MAKNIIRLTESDLHRIVKESAQRIVNEVMNTPGGQFQGGRLAYKKGEEKPIPGQNIGKLRKDPNAPIFNYAEKAGKKAGLKDYGSNFRSGYEYESDLDDFNNAGDDRAAKTAIVVRKILRGGPSFIKKLYQICGDRRSLDSLSDDELLDIVKNAPLSGRFPEGEI